MLRKWNRDFFQQDLAFIRSLESATGTKDVKAESIYFRDGLRQEGQFFRRAFRLRVSGRKALRLALELFSKAMKERAPLE